MHVLLRRLDRHGRRRFTRLLLAASGASPTARPACDPQHGEGYYATFVRDPDGNRIEAGDIRQDKNSSLMRLAREQAVDRGSSRL